MSVLFTPERRAEILHDLIDLFQADAHITGLVVVGSAATAFTDAYSDIDLLVITATSEAQRAVYQRCETAITARYTVVACYEQECGGHYETSLLLDNFLQIDCHFVLLDQLVVERPQWEIVHDPQGWVAQRLAHAQPAPPIASAETTYQEIIQRVWRPVIHATIALKRGEIWRALYLVEAVRGDVVKLAGLRYGVDGAAYRGVDHLPEMFLVHLRHTLPTSTSVPAIRRALRVAVDLLFNEAATLDRDYGLSLAADLEPRLSAYLDAYG